MKLWLVCAAFVAAFVPVSTLSADEINHQQHSGPTTLSISGSQVAECKDADVPFGHFGYKHCTLHKYGTIDELFERTKSKCCEGVMSGECRATTIDFSSGKPMAEIDGRRCEVTAKVHTDISFPAGVAAVVCASQASLADSSEGVTSRCPAVYCAAVATGF